jgi:hypothetical protein
MNESLTAHEPIARLPEPNSVSPNWPESAPWWTGPKVHTSEGRVLWARGSRFVPGAAALAIHKLRPRDRAIIVEDDSDSLRSVAPLNPHHTLRSLPLASHSLRHMCRCLILFVDKLRFLPSFLPFGRLVEIVVW